MIAFIAFLIGFVLCGAFGIAVAVFMLALLEAQRWDSKYGGSTDGQHMGKD